jgi:uncharacterized protein YggE
VPRERMVLTGCRHIRTVLLVVDERKAQSETKTWEEAVQAANQMNNAVVEALGLKTTTRVIELEDQTETGVEQK